jgi:large subunit ribosomal protein L21
MYAIIQTGGKQYKVSPGDVVDLESLGEEANSVVQFDQVLTIGDGDSISIGEPHVAGASVSAEVVENRRGKKVIAFKMKRRKGYKRKVGHRQEQCRVRILEINKSGSAAASAPEAGAPEDEAAE